MAITQQQILFRQLTSVFTHRLLRYGRRYRYAIIRGAIEQPWLHHPTSLLKLALFLFDAQVHTRKAHLPLLLAAHQPLSESFLCVAIPAASSAGTKHVILGRAYREAAEQCRARIRHDSFDACVVEVAEDDLKPFIQALQKI